MTKNTAAFGGFDELVNFITKVDKDPMAKTDDESPLKLSKSVDDDIDDVDDNTDTEDVDTEDVDTEDVTEEVEDDSKGDDTDDDSDATDMSDVEPEVSSYFATSLIEKLGVEVTDKNAKFEKLDDIVNLMSEIIQVNSKPKYASPEVEEYDNYVHNGGTLKTFYDQIYKDSIDVDKIDIKDEKSQKAVIEANLKALGYKEERIKKTIERYEDAEVLEDEATDALESLKELQVKKSKTLLADQEKERIESEKRNKEFFDNVVKYVNNTNNILGVDLDSKTKNEIVDYIFRVKPDGSTSFQKDYAADLVKSLVESAYVKKYGDILLNKTSKKATDAALNKVRNKLKASKGKRNTGSGSGLGKASPNFSALSGLIIK